MWLALSVAVVSIALAVWFGWQRSRLAEMVGQLERELQYSEFRVASLEDEIANLVRAPLDGPSSVAALRRLLDSDDG